MISRAEDVRIRSTPEFLSNPYIHPVLRGLPVDSWFQRTDTAEHIHSIVPNDFYTIYMIDRQR